MKPVRHWKVKRVSSRSAHPSVSPSDRVWDPLGAVCCGSHLSHSHLPPREMWEVFQVPLGSLALFLSFGWLYTILVSTSLSPRIFYLISLSNFLCCLFSFQLIFTRSWVTYTSTTSRQYHLQDGLTICRLCCFLCFIRPPSNTEATLIYSIALSVCLVHRTIDTYTIYVICVSCLVIM